MNGEPVLIKTDAWLDQAACVGHDPEWWAPRGNGPAITCWSRLNGDEQHDNKVRAWRICAGCPVKAQCLAKGQSFNAVGLWGGVWL